MSDKDKDETRQAPTEKLAALVEQRRRDAAEGARKPKSPNARSERAAAQHSASKSKPALRK